MCTTSSLKPPFYKEWSLGRKGRPREAKKFAKGHTVTGRANTQTLLDLPVQGVNHYSMCASQNMVYGSSAMSIEMQISESH